MCVCVCMYALLGVYVCMHMHIYVCTNTCVHMGVYIHMYAYLCMCVPTHAYLHVGMLQVCVPLFACVVLCLCVFWPTRSVLCAQTSRVIHQGDSTNQIKQETNYSSFHSFGSETQREHTTGGEAKVVSWLLCCWFWHLSPVLYFRRGKTDSSWGDRKQGRGSENSVHHHQHRLGAGTFTEKHKHCCMLFKCH